MPYMNVNDMDEARQDAMYRTNLISEMSDRITELEDQLFGKEVELQGCLRLIEILKEQQNDSCKNVSA